MQDDPDRHGGYAPDFYPDNPHVRFCRGPAAQEMLAKTAKPRGRGSTYPV